MTPNTLLLVLLMGLLPSPLFGEEEETIVRIAVIQVIDDPAGIAPSLIYTDLDMNLLAIYSFFQDTFIASDPTDELRESLTDGGVNLTECDLASVLVVVRSDPPSTVISRTSSGGAFVIEVENQGLIDSIEPGAPRMLQATANGSRICLDVLPDGEVPSLTSLDDFRAELVDLDIGIEAAP